MALIKTSAQGLTADANNWNLLSSQTASGDSEVVFNSSLITNSYDTYFLTFRDIDMGTDSVSLRLRISSDNGSSYFSSADYKRVTMYGLHSDTDNSNMPYKTSAFDHMNLGGTVHGIGTTDKETVAGHCWLYNLRVTDRGKCFLVHSVYETGAEKGALNTGMIYIDTDILVNAVKVYPQSGTFSGTVSLYGVKG